MTNLDGENRLALLLQQVPGLQIAVCSTQIEKRTFGRRPTTVSELHRAILRPDYGTLLTILRPDASIPISNCEKVLEEGRVAG